MGVCFVWGSCEASGQVNWGPAVGDMIRDHTCSSIQTCGRTEAVVTPILHMRKLRTKYGDSGSHLLIDRASPTSVRHGPVLGLQ